MEDLWKYSYHHLRRRQWGEATGEHRTPLLRRSPRFLPCPPPCICQTVEAEGVPHRSPSMTTASRRHLQKQRRQTRHQSPPPHWDQPLPLCGSPPLLPKEEMLMPPLLPFSPQLLLPSSCAPLLPLPFSVAPPTVGPFASFPPSPSPQPSLRLAQMPTRGGETLKSPLHSLRPSKAPRQRGATETHSRQRQTTSMGPMRGSARAPAPLRRAKGGQHARRNAAGRRLRQRWQRIARH